MGTSKQFQFDNLVSRIQSCTLCPRMQGRRRVLSSANGSLDSAVIFIAEAPGRLGADRFGRPLYGDQTGRNFDMFLSSAGLARDAVFITNAILCNPRTPLATNDSPRISEIRNCSPVLKEVIEIINPHWIIPLGRAALTALNIINPHHIRLSKDVGKVLSWGNYLLYPLFHPGPKGFLHRPKIQQESDYRGLAVALGKSQ